MKNSNCFTRLVLPILALVLFTFSCDAVDNQHEADQPNHQHALQVDPDGVGDITSDELLGFEAEVQAHIDDHSMDLSTLEEVTLERPDGTTEDVYLLEGDIALTKQQVMDYQEAIDLGLKQYRTFNLVSPQNITVIGYTGGSYALTNTMRTALQWAINNYNALPLDITFSLSFSSSTNADIVVYRNPNNNGAGGVAGFPYSNGQPYKWVQIYNGMQNYNTNTNEHVITHEIGHCVGFRHTDWFNRASCGQSGENAGSDGAVHIPGTPTGVDWNSVMLACFSSNEDGEFGYYDRIALQYMY